MSLPWSGPPVVQVENLFGVEQVVEFPKDSMGEKKGSDEKEKKKKRHSRSYRGQVALVLSVVLKSKRGNATCAP